MIIKNADNKKDSIVILELMLACADAGKRTRIADEIRMMHAGIKGENESAYLIDFNFQKSESTAVIHDLRLEVEGRVAQIDHLLIHRTHRFYVLETKSFAHGLKINEHGEFLRWNEWKKNFEGMPSPIEQNRRHIVVLRDLLEQLGYKNPIIESFVLISPNARIDRPKGNDYAEVIKADQFFVALEKSLSSGTSSVGGFFNAAAKVFFGEAPDLIAKKIIRLHRPISIDYAKKFGIHETTPAAATTPSKERTPDPVPVRPVQAMAEKPPAQVVDALPVAPMLPVFACKSCGSGEISIEYGKFGYYFKCAACGANSSFKLGCGVENHKERIRKERLTFYRECEGCGSSTVFFVNKS
jgi:hypothetical protein